MVLNVEDLERERRERLRRAEAKDQQRAQRIAGTPPDLDPRVRRPSTIEQAFEGFDNFPDADAQNLNDPEEATPAEVRHFGQGLADKIGRVAAGEDISNPLEVAGRGLFNVLDFSGKIAENVARPVIFGAQNYLIPGQQAFQRAVNEKREAGLGFADALGEAYEETNLEGPVIPFFTTAFTPNGSITIDFEDVIEAGFDPIDLALTLGAGGLGKGVSVAGKQGLLAGAKTAAQGSTGARLATSAARTGRRLVEDPLEVIVPSRLGLENLAPRLDVKPKIAARIPDISTIERQALRPKSVTRGLAKAKNLPLAESILGLRPVRALGRAAAPIARVFDPSQVAGSSPGRKAQVIHENAVALGANAVDAGIAYVNPDNLRKAFNYDPRAGRIRATNIGLTPHGEKLVREGKLSREPLLGDLLEGALFDESGRAGRMSAYSGLDAAQRAALTDFRDATEAFVQMGVDEGVIKLKPGAIPGRLWKSAVEVETGASLEDIWFYAHRKVRTQSYVDDAGKEAKVLVNRAGGQRGGNSSFEKGRVFEYGEEGVQGGNRAYADPVESLEMLGGGIYRMIAEKRVKQFLDREGQLITGEAALRRLYPEIVDNLTDAEKFANATQANVNRLQRKGASRKAKRTPLKDELSRADSELAAVMKEHDFQHKRFSELVMRRQAALDRSKNKKLNDGNRRKARADAKRLEGRIAEQGLQVSRARSDFRKAYEAIKGNTGAHRARTRLAHLEDEMMAITNDLTVAQAEADLAKLTLVKARELKADKLAQISESTLLDARLFGLTDEPGRQVPVGRFDRGALQGSLAPLETRDILEKTFSDTGNEILRKIEMVTGTARTLSTGLLDVGWLTLQGSLLAFTHPRIFSKAAKESLQAVANPARRDLYLKARMPQLIDGIENGLDIGSSEFFQAIDRNGLLGRVNQWALDKTEGGTLLGDAVEVWGRQVRPIARLGTGFNLFLDMAKLEMWMAMSGLTIANDITKRELATHINSMMGTMNTSLLGVQPSQRQLEGAVLLFSPRYTRSAFALMGDLLQSPGKMGTLDGLAQRHAMRAMAGFVAGGTTAMWAVGQATGQEPELNPMKPGWLTVNIGGQNVGIGGSTRAMLDMMFKSTAAVAGVDNRELPDIMNFNIFNPEARRTNPLVQYWLNRTAPGVRETLLRESFDGEQLDSPGEFVAKGIAPKFLPFALQAQFDPPQGVQQQSPVALIPEVLGLRARPLSAFERRNKRRDELAQEAEGKTWDELDFDKQAVIRRDNPGLQELEEISRGIDDPVFSPYFNRINRDRQITDNAIANASAQFRVNPAGGRTFRESYDEAIAQSRLLREVREDRNGEYGHVIDRLEELREEGSESETIFNLLFDEYITTVRDNPDHRDIFGNTDFDKIDAAEAKFKEKVGPEIFQRVRAYYLGIDAQGDQLRDTPPEVVALRRAREGLRQTGYWNIPDKYTDGDPLLMEVFAEYQTLDNPAAREALKRRFPELNRVARLVARDRKRLRLRNPDVDRALVLFYGLRAVNPAVRVEERQLLRASLAQGRSTTEGSFGPAL